MGKIVDMLYRTIRHQQPVLKVKVTSALRRPLKDVFEEVHIIRMDSLQYQFTVVNNLETGEPLWFGPDRKQETLDEFFRTQLGKFSGSASRRLA
jgi:hypothetical protein